MIIQTENLEKVIILIVLAKFVMKSVVFGTILAAHDPRKV